MDEGSRSSSGWPTAAGPREGESNAHQKSDCEPDAAGERPLVVGRGGRLGSHRRLLCQVNLLVDALVEEGRSLGQQQLLQALGSRAGSGASRAYRS